MDGSGELGKFVKGDLGIKGARLYTSGMYNTFVVEDSDSMD